MYVVFITAYSASGQAHFQSPALQQFKTQVLYFILCGFVAFTPIYNTPSKAFYSPVSLHKAYMKILLVHINNI